MFFKMDLKGNQIHVRLCTLGKKTHFVIQEKLLGPFVILLVQVYLYA